MVSFLNLRRNKSTSTKWSGLRASQPLCLTILPLIDCVLWWRTSGAAPPVPSFWTVTAIGFSQKFRSSYCTLIVHSGEVVSTWYLHEIANTLKVRPINCSSVDDQPPNCSVCKRWNSAADVDTRTALPTIASVFSRQRTFSAFFVALGLKQASLPPFPSIATMSPSESKNWITTGLPTRGFRLSFQPPWPFWRRSISLPLSNRHTVSPLRMDFPLASVASYETSVITTNMTQDLTCLQGQDNCSSATGWLIVVPALSVYHTMLTTG